MAAVLAFVGHHAQRDWAEKAEAARLLATTSQPAPMAIEEYDGPRTPGLTEVNLRVRLLSDYGVHLHITGKTPREYYIVPFRADRGGDDKEVLGAMMLTPEERERFLALEDLKAVVLPDGFHAILPGMIDAPRDRSEARDAIAERGAVIGADFLFLSPFLEPRDAAIARIVKNYTESPPALFFNTLAAIFALIGAAKFLLSRRRRGRPARPSPTQPSPTQNLLRTGSAEEARTAAELGYVPSGQKMFGIIPIPKMSRAVGLVVFVLSAGLWLRLKMAPELGAQQWAEIAVVIAVVALLQFWPLIRARLTHGQRRQGPGMMASHSPAPPAQPIRMEPVRLSDFMAQRDGMGGSTAAMPPPLPAGPPPMPGAAQAPQVQAPQAQAPLAQAGLVAQVLQLGALVPAPVRLWGLLFVTAALGARLLPPEMRASYGTLISVVLSFGMIGLLVWAYLRAIGQGVGAVLGAFPGASRWPQQGAAPTEDPFDRLHRRLRG